MNRTFIAVLAALASPFLLSFPACAAIAGLVTNANDSGPGSLRAAMARFAGTIEFDPVFFSTPRTISLLSVLPSIERDLSIIGPGADLLRVDGEFRTNGMALITNYSARTVRLEGFTLAGGYDPLSTGNVGGIFNRGNMTLERMVLDDNRGTAIFNQGGMLTITQSTLSNNTGEGIFNQVGTLAMSQSSLFGNDRSGVFNQSGRTTLINSTVAENNGGISNQGGHLALQNSTIAKNLRFGVAGNFDSQGGGLRVTSSLLADNELSDLNADAISSVSHSLVELVTGAPASGVGNIVGVDPQLGPLADNGGPTLTILPGSIVHDVGSNPLGLTTDQRGVPRVIGPAADIGAVERVPEPVSYVLVVATIAVAGLSRRGSMGLSLAVRLPLA